MVIGKYKLDIVETGTFALDGGAMFGIIPKPLWQKTNEPDELNRIKLGARCLLLRSTSKTILIDTGMGGHHDEKFLKIYGVDQSVTTLEKSLSSLGVEPADITDVLLTHLHFDHTGGSTKFENGKWIPAFANAKYYIQKKHFEWAKNPSERDRGSFISHRFMPLAEEGVLNFVDGSQDFDDEIFLIEINGHTFSQQLMKISDSKETLLYCGDLLPFTSHIPLPYVMGYDLQPAVTVEEKKKLFPKAVEENWKLYFEHDPYTVMATAAKTEKGYTVGEKFTGLI